MEVLLINDILKNIILYIYKYCNKNIGLTITELKKILINQDFSSLNNEFFYKEIIKDYRIYLINLIYSEVLAVLVYKNDDKELLRYVYNMFCNNLTNKFPYNDVITTKILESYINYLLEKEINREDVKIHTFSDKKTLNLVKKANPLYPLSK